LTSPSSAEASPPEAAAGPGPRRRIGIPELLAVAIGIVVIAVAAAWLVPPLGTGNAGVAAGPPGSEQTPDPTGGGDGGDGILYVPSGEVRFGVEVRNTTFVPVTIDGLTDGTDNFLLGDSRLILGTDPELVDLADAHVRTFTPITLGPGETVLVGVVGRFPSCADARPNWATGVGVTVYTLWLDTHVAGVLPVQTGVALLMPVGLVGNADAACPR
jgi:hypothetical protein